MKPNLFIPGAPKSGSTSLYYYLSQVPEVFVSPKKEINYFCKDHLEENIKFHGKQFNYSGIQTFTDENYLKYFKGADEKKHKYASDSSVWYFSSKKAAQEIYNFNNNAKVILLLREPVDLLYAYHSTLLLVNSESESDFEKALALEEERKKGNKLVKSIAWPSRLYYSEFMKLSEHVERYLKVFPKENIKILFLEDMKKDINTVWQEIMDFLNIETEVEIDFSIRNSHRSPILMPKLPGPIKDFLNRVIPISIQDTLDRWLRHFFSVKKKRKPMNENLRKELMKKFYPEVEKLSKLLERDLIKFWGYDKV